MALSRHNAYVFHKYIQLYKDEVMSGQKKGVDWDYVDERIGRSLVTYIQGLCDKTENWKQHCFSGLLSELLAFELFKSVSTTVNRK